MEIKPLRKHNTHVTGVEKIKDAACQIPVYS